jgi:hypothetical protein
VRRPALIVAALAGPLAIGSFLAGSAAGDLIFRSRLARYEVLARDLDDASPAAFEAQLQRSPWSLRLCCTIILPALWPNGNHGMKLVRFVLARGRSYLFVVSDTSPASIYYEPRGDGDTVSMPRDVVLSRCSSPDLPQGWCREYLKW